VPAAAAITGEPLLDVRGVVKHFGRVQALAGVDMEVHPGSIVALLGDNGAGKSTLVKIIAGVYQPDAGEIRFAGRRVHIDSPKDASALGIETVYQDLALCDNLSVVQNLFLGRERRMPDLPFINRFLDNRRMRQEAETVVAQLGTRLPSLSTQIGAMSGGQRQAVAVARAVIWGSRLVLLDEPTAALGVQQTANVHNLIKRLRDKGVAIVLITHNLVDAFALADSMVVLRLGRRIAIMDAKRNTPDEVVGAITGSTLAMRSTA
jgi:D-xylose transport system ATP-binding protein